MTTACPRVPRDEKNRGKKQNKTKQNNKVILAAKMKTR